MGAHQTFQVDLRGMVDLLARHLYSGPRVYVRELLQNAVDAVTARREVEPDAPATVRIVVHPDGPVGAPGVSPGGRLPVFSGACCRAGLVPADVASITSCGLDV